MICSVPAGAGYLWMDWVVGLSLLGAAFFHFLINRDPVIREARAVVASRWVLFAGLAGLGARYVYSLLSGSHDVMATVPTNMGLFAVSVSQVWFGLYTFNKHHRSSSAPVSPVPDS